MQAVTTYLAILSNGETDLQVCFDHASDNLGDLLEEAFFATSEDDLEAMPIDKKVWVSEIRNALTGHLVYFNDLLRIPEEYRDRGHVPMTGSECFLA